jgi:hypothetical protein
MVPLLLLSDCGSKHMKMWLIMVIIRATITIFMSYK